MTFHKNMRQDVATSVILKSVKKENYAKMQEIIRLLPLGTKWSVTYADSSIVVHTEKHRSAIKVTDKTIYIDRKLKSGVKSLVVECDNIQETIDNFKLHFHRINKSLYAGVINEPQIETESIEETIPSAKDECCA